MNKRFKAFFNIHPETSKGYVLLVLRTFMLAVLVGIAMSVVNSHRTFALSIDDIPTNLTGPIQTYDFTESSCESSSPDQYQYTAWMSPTSTPSDNSTLTEPSNQPFTQDLEYNELIFLCHTIVTPGAGQPTINPPILPTINPGYNSGNPPAANNTQFIPSAVYDTSGTNAYAVPYDATPSRGCNDLVTSYDDITQATITENGNQTTVPINDLTHVGCQTGTRYWFNNPASAEFALSSPAITQPTTITITLTTILWNDYANGSDICAGSPYNVTTDSTAPTTCNPASVTETLEVTPTPSTQTTVGGTVYGYNNGKANALNGVSVTDCDGDTSTSGNGGTTGQYTFTINSGQTFCAQVPSTVTIGGVNYDDPVITSSSPPTNYPPASCNSDASSWPSQTAGSPSTGTCAPGNNMLYNFEYTSTGVVSNPPETVGGTVYGYNNGKANALNGVSVTDCDGDTSTSGNGGTTGQYTFTINSGQTFCAQVPSTVTIGGVNYDDPVITSSSPPTNYPPASCNSDASSWPSQTAGSPSTGTCAPGNNMLYNFEYTTSNSSGSNISIEGQAVGTNNDINSALTPTVNIVGVTGASLTENPFEFSSPTYNLAANSVYTLTASESVTASGNTYNLIGADWCQGSSCVPDPATENTLSGGNEVQVLTGASGEVVVYWEYKEQQSIVPPGINIVGQDVGTNNQIISTIDPIISLVGEPSPNTSALNPFSFPSDDDDSYTFSPNSIYSLTADKTVIAGGNTYNLIGADWCQGSSCVPDPATENTLSGGNEVQVLTGASGEVVVYWEYEEQQSISPPGISIGGQDVGINNAIISTINPIISLIGEPSPNISALNPFSFPSDDDNSYSLSPNSIYTLTADKTVIAGGNTYNLIGADWCQGSSCVPDPATENTLSGGNEVQVLTGASGEVVVYWEYESNSNVNYTTITGTIWNNTAGTADPYPNATVVAFCDNNEGVQTDCTGSQPANDSGGTINQTGPGGNWQLKLPQGVQYFIYVESPPPGAQTLQMDYDPTTNTSYAHPTTGSGLSVEYDPTIDSGTVTGNWDFYYKSSSGGGSQTVSITGRVYENGGTGIKDNGAYPDVVACDASGANCTDDPNNTDDGGNNHPGLTGPGGNWSLTLTVGGAYEIKVESGIDTITYPLLALAGGAYPEAGSGIGQYYTPRADSPTTTPSNGGWDFHYYNSGCNGIGCTGGGGTPTSCPTFPNYQSVNVPLAYAGENNPAPPTTSSQPADQATPAPIEQDTPVEVYYNSPSSSLPNGSITDISTGVKDQTPSHNPQYVSQNTAVNGGSVNLNYAPYATYYPYDTSLPQVNYYSVWNKIIWTPTLSGLSCPDGGTVSGTNCVYTQSANSSTSYSCPGGGTLGGTTCFTGAGKVVKGVCKGVSYNGGCYASSYGATANTSYSCPAGDGTVSGPDSNHVCTYTYTATANYNWTAGSPTQKYSTPADTTDGTLMPECYNRTLSLQPQTGSIGFDNYEDPTAINYNGSVVANYGVTVPVSTALGLRVPSSAKDISLSMTVTIQQLNGDTITNTYPLPNYANTVTPNPYSTSLTTSGSAPDITGNFTGQLTSLSETDTGSFGVAYQIPASDQIGGGGPNPFFQYGDRVCAVLSANPSGSQVDDTGTVALPTGPTAGAQTCSDPLAAQPYVQVFGGDVDSGVATKTPSDGTENCTVNSSAPVDTWNQATGEYDGSGTDLATIAAGDINGFASAQDNTGTFPPLSGSSPPDALSFANTLSNPPAVNLGGGQYGGDFGASSNDCINDYYSAGQPTAIASLGQDIGPSLLAALSSVPGSIPGGGLQVLGGTITIDDFPLADRWTDPNGVQYGIIPDKYNLTFYSSGPINIDTNILYPQPPSVITSGSGTPVIPANLPDLQIITLGDNVYGEADINIENTVTALAGTYISESGAINDCTLYSGSDPYVPNPIVPSDQWYYDPNNSTVPEDQTCDRQLTVYGSFVANNIGLDRTYGSLHEASNNATSSSTSSAAEVFDYTALNWLAYPPPNPATTKPPAVQAITSLPPVL